MKSFFLLLTVGLMGAFALVQVGGHVAAHEGATGVVKERMAAMKSMGNAMKSLKSALWRGKPLVEAREAVEGITRHAGSIPELFPEGSGEDPSEATPAVWSERQRFSELSEELASRAETLARTLGIGDRNAAKAAFRDVGAVCSRCHEDFREKK